MRNAALERVREGCLSGFTPLSCFSRTFSRTSKPLQHEPDHDQIHHIFATFREILIILTHTTRTPYPRKCSFYHPTPRQNAPKFLGFRFDAFPSEPYGAEV